ncbi:MAG TPA: endolytic transglycosylase MltG [Candidatus Saccharimonadales bacterium]|nr:endolytic transglycosylase MltG [Candidatus Saccharimonadales bacterium]
MRAPKLSLPRVRKSWLILAVILVLLVGAAYGGRAWYNRNLAAVSSSQQVVNITIVSGSSLHDISTDLKNAGLIRSTTAFETYVRGRQLYAKMQAGTYALTPSMSTPQIVDKIVKGEVARDLLTILPGKTIVQIRQAFKQAGYSDRELDVAFDPSTYPDEPVLDSLPSGASLEGFLYPDSFQKEAATPAQTIIRESLEEMQNHLTHGIVEGFSAHGLNIYQGVTLASIVYKESGNPQYEPTVAQVFLSRLKQGSALGSDVTAIYGAVKDGVDLPAGNPERAAAIAINHDSPYNTRIHNGLPPGPISNMTDDALKSVANPSKTDYLYFVNGNDCRLHFAHTIDEHNQNIQKYGSKACS